MKKKMFLYLIVLQLISCSPAPKGKDACVWVSIAPYQGLVQRLVGKEIEVQTVAPSNVNPHNFEITAKQLAQISQGKAWFLIGEPFEKKLVFLLRQNAPHLVTADLRNYAKLLCEKGEISSCCDTDQQDRHIWMSPRETHNQMIETAKILQEIFSEKKHEIEENLQLLLTDLRKLDQDIETLLAPVKCRGILVSHPAFGYFCKRYACKQLSVEYEGKDPRPKHIETIFSQAKLQHASIAFALPQHNNRGVQRIAEMLHIPIRMINPYSSEYFDTLWSLAQIIATYQPEETP